MVKKFIGFTFSEIFVVLFLIGFIATLVIPPLISNVTNAGHVSRVLKCDESLSNAVNFLMAKHRYGSLSGKYANAGAFWNDFKNSFALSKDCGTSVNQGCLPSQYKYINNSLMSTNICSDSYNGVAKAILGDGSSIGIIQQSVNCNTDYSKSGTGPLTTVCYSVYVDINGISGPNQEGRDLFTWWILNDGTFEPAGSDDSKYAGCSPSSTDTSPGTDGAAGFGAGCTTKLIKESAINY